MNNFESSTTPKPPRFPLGQVYCTPAAAEALQRLQVNPLLLLGRHISGDPGYLCSEDALANEDALRYGIAHFFGLSTHWQEQYCEYLRST
jgi:hypothetical protein